MKRVFTLFFLLLLRTTLVAQDFELSRSEFTIGVVCDTVQKKLNAFEIEIKIKKITDSAKKDKITLKIRDLGPSTVSPKFIGSDSALADTVSVPVPTVKKGETFSKRLLIAYNPGKTDLVTNEIALINLDGGIDFIRLNFKKQAPILPSRIHLVPEISRINPLISDSSIHRDESVKIKIYKQKSQTSLDTTMPQTLLFRIKPNQNTERTELPFSLLNLSRQDIDHLNINDTVTKTIALRVHSVNKFDDMKHEYVDIQIQGDTSVRTLHITTEGAWSASKPFWVEIGANLDLIDGLEANNFFSGVFVYKRDIRPIFSSKGQRDKVNRLGMFAGVFESKTLSNTILEESAEKTGNKRTYFDRTSLSLRAGDSVGVFVDTGQVKLVQTVRNIGLFFSPQVRLSNGSSNADGIHFFVSFWAELQWQRVAIESSYKDMRRIDTLFVPASSIGVYSPTEAKTEIDIRSHYFGFGLPLFYKDNYTNLFVNPVFGVSNQPSAQKLEAKMKNPDKELMRIWLPFYVIQFRLNEDKYGISFTGEVRGLLKKSSPPFVTIALSKKFDLAKFVEFTR